MWKRIFLVLMFCITCFPPSVFSDCTLPLSILPPERAYGSLLVMDGYEWGVTESREGNTITRNIYRKHFDYPDEDAYITKEQAEEIADLFFQRNEDILGVPEQIIVNAEEGVLPVKVTFISTEKQYCEGLEVIGTVSGTLYIGGGDEFQVSSLDITWYVSITLDELTPKISSQEIIKNITNFDPDAKTDPELAILPVGDDFKLVWKIKDGNKTRLFDAKTGNETSARKEYVKSLILKIFIVSLIAFFVIWFGYYYLKKKKILR